MGLDSILVMLTEYFLKDSSALNNAPASCLTEKRMLVLSLPVLFASAFPITRNLVVLFDRSSMFLAITLSPYFEAASSEAIAAELSHATGESKVCFYNIEAAEVKNPYVGMAIKNLKNCFDVARKQGENSASVLFFDELDMLTSTRTEGRHEAEISKALQIELDGLKERGSIIPIGATNRPFNLPFELLREGRFGTPIFIPPPDLEARVAIFEQLINKETAEYFNYGAIDLQALGHETEGYSGADIKGIIREVVRTKTGTLISDIDKKSIYEIAEELMKLKVAKRKVTIVDFQEAIANHKSTLPIWYTQVKTALQLAPKEVRAYFADLVAVVESQNPGSITSSPPPGHVAHGISTDLPAEDLLQKEIDTKREEVKGNG